MKRPRRGIRRTSVLGVASAVMAAALAGPALAGTQATKGPTVKLVAAQKDITVQSLGGAVILDPGIYVVSLGSALQLDVQRASYTEPITVAQVIHLPGGSLTTPWPASVLDGFYGLRDFAHLTVANATGKVVASSPEELCPNSDSPQRAVPNSVQTSPFPQACALDPFAKGLVMGIAKGWGVDSFVSLFHLAPATYKVTATVAPQFMRLLDITPANATASVNVTVTKGSAGGAARRIRPQAAALPELPAAPVTTRPPESALPDLVTLPAWGIDTAHLAGRDLLDFSATVWVGGNGPLDVQGFRVNSSPVMTAYQYFWQNGQVIGRARAGTMGFDSQPGHNHWHFEQFAAYTLLGQGGKVAVHSQKTGFCISPTDPVDLLLPDAVWQPSFVGFANQCGSPTALWVQEMMPVGWGDTYMQSLAGQAFDITRLPNGTYDIEVAANPEHVLYETNTRDNVSLREVILGGTPGHRTVKVPAWHGIDPES